jgi:membrane protein YqaA with SNARE-associated domain
MPTRIILISKALWQSATIWFNALALVALALDAATAANLPFVGSEWFVFAVLIVNGLLRWWRTTQPVTLTGGDPVEVEALP